MQIKYLHKNIYKLYRYARPQESLEACRKKYEEPVSKWETLKERGIEDSVIAEFAGISRATYYRYKRVLQRLAQGLFPMTQRPKTVRQSKISQSSKDLVLKLRHENPTYGKDKIAVILKRDHGSTLSVSSVGRILKEWKDKGMIQKSFSALRPKRRRSFTQHAKPWAYGMKSSKPGEMVQIDHMTVSKNGLCMKHFQAWDPITKTLVAEVYSNATSHTGRKFLLKVIQALPFKLLSIQVDGGSEFMAHFEEACQELNIPLFVLPPKRPQYNGGVERANRTFREEFYAKHDLLADSLGAMRFELSSALLKYNTFRPHSSLQGLTPSAYTSLILKVAS